MILLLVSLLVGLVLGQRFKVLVLIPAAVPVLTLAIFVGIVRGDSFWPITITALGAITSLQLGYFLGLAMRFWLVAVHSKPSPTTPQMRSTPTRRPAH
jgi:hypothetical protein